MSDVPSLAAQKPFAELAPHERARVLAEMSAAEYDHLHALLHTARALDEEAVPPFALGERLQAHMSGRRKQRRPLLRMLDLPLPLWQAAATVVLALLAGYFFKGEKPAPASHRLVQTVIQHDTVVLEKVVWKERAVVRWRKSAPARSPAVAALPTPTAGMDQPESEPANPIDLAPTTTAIGVRLSDQQELWQFFTRPEGKSR